MTLESLITFITPSNCSVCGMEGDELCKVCLIDALKPLHSRCYRCNKLTSSFATCRSCRSTSSLKHVHAAADYDGLTKELIHKYKFGQRRQLSSVFCNIMQKDEYKFSFDLVSFVPTTPKRVRQRGFDHARRLAKDIARESQIPFRELIVKTNNSRQVGSSRAERIRNAQQSFRYTSKLNLIDGQRVLLVDDVISSGSSAEACAKTLKQNGAKSVSLSVIAKNYKSY